MIKGRQFHDEEAVEAARQYWEEHPPPPLTESQAQVLRETFGSIKRRDASQKS